MRFLLPVLLLASLGLAMPFGPAGVPLVWDFGIISIEADTLEASAVEADHGLFGVNLSSPLITSPSATSNLSFTSSADADSLVWTQTQANGDNDMVFKFVEDDGTVHFWQWDDASSWWHTGENAFIGGVLIARDRLQTLEVRGSGAAGSTLLLNPPGSGVLSLGNTGDNDINYLNGRLRTNITTVDSTYVMGAADGWMFTMTANDTLKCPVTPIAGEVLECKFTNASGGVLSGNGNTIDGATEIAASENDNIRIVWNATTSEWEVR